MKQSTVLQADRMNLIPSYIFKETNRLKADRLREGSRVIDLAMGNPIDPTPSGVVDTLCSHIQNPDNHRYPASSGMDDFKKEIARWYRNEYSVGLDHDNQVICTIGSKEGLSHLMLAMVDYKDTVLVPSPSFPVHEYGPLIAGAGIIKIALNDQQQFLEDVELTCRNQGCSLVILNYPHNPTGKVVDLDFFRNMVFLAKKYGFYIIHDFAYSKITFDSFKAPSFLMAEGACDVGVEFGTFSKTFNMAGWRIGYCVGNPDLVSSLAKIKGYFDYGIFSPIQYAGINALKSCGQETEEQVSKYQKRRDIVFKKLKKAGYTIEKPRGGMFCWSKIPSSFKGDSSAGFVEELFTRTGVLVTPGRAFGAEGDSYFRIALVQDEQVMDEAIELMARAFPG